MNMALLKTFLIACSFGFTTNDTFGMQQEPVTAETRLTVAAFSQTEAALANADCAICREPLTTKGSDYQLPCNIRLVKGMPTSLTTSCGHTFHTNCLLNWIVNNVGGLERARGCPMCRNTPAMQAIYDTHIRPSLRGQASTYLNTHFGRVFLGLFAAMIAADVAAGMLLRRSEAPERVLTGTALVMIISPTLFFLVPALCAFCLLS